MPVVDDATRYLLGRWTVRRRLADLRSGGRGRFDGLASFTPDASDGLAYREEGELVWPTHTGHAGRELHFTDRGTGRLLVAFSDGRPFHELELVPDGFTAVHRCGSDLYVGRFVARSELAWTSCWWVRGPAKAIVIATAYGRLSRPSEAQSGCSSTVVALRGS